MSDGKEDGGPSQAGGPRPAARIVACVTCRPIAHACDAALMSLQGHATVWRVRNASLLCNARSQVVERAFRECGAERLLFVDDDIAFQPADALDLLYGELPADCAIAGGLYGVKGERRLCGVGFVGEIVLGQRGFYPATHLGAGFLLITRRAFELLQDLPAVTENDLQYRPYFCPAVYPFMGRQALLGEDYAFCEELRKRGGQIYLATGPRLGHVGEWTWFVEDSLAAVGGRFSPLASRVLIDAQYEKEPNK